MAVNVHHGRKRKILQYFNILKNIVFDENKTANTGVTVSRAPLVAVLL